MKRQDMSLDILRWVKQDQLVIIVRPSSPQTKVLGWDDVRQALRVAIAAPPEDNKANLEVIKFFSKLLKKRVRILRGLTSREKVLHVEEKASSL